jgi:hypothetical protein
MVLTPASLAVFVSWVATGLGVGLWLWSWVREKNAIQRQRFLDCGLVLVFAAILVRIAVQDSGLSPFDWALIFLSPLFIAAALWRLARTACPTERGR